MSACVYIYVLVDPDNPSVVRYVGKTGNIHERFKGHLKKARNPKSYKDCWVASLLSRGVEPMMKIIEECTEDKWQRRERFWIKHYRAIVGDKLTNGTGGGDGLHEPTQEVRDKISQSLTGRIYTEEMRRSMEPVWALIKGRKHSEETRQKISEACRHNMTELKRTTMLKNLEKGRLARKGVPMSEEHKRKIGEANAKKPGRKKTQEEKDKISKTLIELHKKRRKSNGQ